MRVVILSSYAKSLLWFRTDLMTELKDSGHEVIALADDPSRDVEEQLARLGVEYRSFPVSRNGLSPTKDIVTLCALIRMMREIRPDVVYAYQVKTIVYGVPAAWRAGVRRIFPHVAGLGSIFRSTGLKYRAIQSLLRIQYRRAFSLSSRVFFENPDDASVFVSMRLLPKSKIVMLNGSGVNVDRFSVVPLPSEPVFLFVGRLLRDKGVIEYLDACKEVKQGHPDVRCLLVGPYDSNPTSLTPQELRAYVDAGVVEYLGEQSDVRPMIASASVIVLPSYHEGTPVSVLEAMAMGRAVITTDAPGCRETVLDGRNGILVPPRRVSPLVDAMCSLLDQPERIRVMGDASRALVLRKFDVRKVNSVIMSTMGLCAEHEQAANTRV